MALAIPKLTPDQKKKLEDLDADVKTLNKLVGKLDRARLPVEELKVKITVLEQQRKGLLKEFT